MLRAALLAKIEKMHGKARRVWLMDRGIPTEEVLAEMRAAGDAFYLVGTPRQDPAVRKEVAEYALAKSP